MAAGYGVLVVMSGASKYPSLVSQPSSGPEVVPLNSFFNRLHSYLLVLHENLGAFFFGCLFSEHLGLKFFR